MILFCFIRADRAIVLSGLVYIYISIYSFTLLVCIITEEQTGTWRFGFLRETNNICSACTMTIKYYNIIIRRDEYSRTIQSDYDGLKPKKKNHPIQCVQNINRYEIRATWKSSGCRSARAARSVFKGDLSLRCVKSVGVNGIYRYRIGEKKNKSSYCHPPRTPCQIPHCKS